MSSNMYMKFEGPTIGSSTAPGHENEIEILTWSHGFVQPASARRDFAAPHTLEQATHQNFSFTKYLDSATNELIRYNWSGKLIKKATLRCYRADGVGDTKEHLYLEVIMENVLIADLKVSGGASDLPVENVTLDYGIVQYSYKDQKQVASSADAKPPKHNLMTKTVE